MFGSFFNGLEALFCPVLEQDAVNADLHPSLISTDVFPLTPLLFPLHKMTAPLKQLPVNGEDCVELRKIGDHVSVGRSSPFDSHLAFGCSLLRGTGFIVVYIQNKHGEVKMVP